MTKYEIAVRLLAEYCDCPSKDGMPTEIPEEWCEKHCDYKGDAEEETVECWEKVISDRYEAQGEEDKTELCEDVISRQAAIDAIYEHEFSNWCDKDEVSTILNDLPSVACNCSEPPNGSECEDAVSRQAVIDALERIFDRCEEIEAHLPEGDPDRTGYKMFPDYMTVWKYLHQLPSAQFEVIRCKDCIYQTESWCGIKYCEAHGDHIGKDYDYCSNARRKDNVRFN